MKLNISVLYIIFLRAGILAAVVPRDFAKTGPEIVGEPLSIMKRSNPKVEVAIPPGVAVVPGTTQPVDSSGTSPQTEAKPEQPITVEETTPNDTEVENELIDELLAGFYPEDALDQEWDRYLENDQFEL